MKSFRPAPKKTNSKFILKMYDKNLTQKYGGFVTCEIPISWDFFDGFIPFFGDLGKKCTKSTLSNKKSLSLNRFLKAAFY